MDLKLSLEYREVALRPEHIMASELSRREIDTLIDDFLDSSEAVAVTVRVRPLSIDPNDNMVFDVAMSGRADALVTANAKHFTTAGKRPSITVLSPRELLQTIRKGETHGS